MSTTSETEPTETDRTTPTDESETDGTPVDAAPDQLEADPEADEHEDGLIPDDVLDKLVGDAVRTAVKKEISAVVADRLTPDRVSSLRTRAAAAAEAKLSDDPTPTTPATTAVAVPAVSEPPPEAAKELTYGSVVMFVRDHMTPMYRRRVDGQKCRWVGDWWLYAEAIDVLDALWRAWEHLSLDGRTGMSVWWRDHARPHMGALMGPESSPFPAEKVTVMTKVTEPLPFIEPPAGMFRDERGFEAVTAAILQLLIDHTVSDWETRFSGYLTDSYVVAAAHFAAQQPMPAPTGPVTFTETGEHTYAAAVPTSAGTANVDLIRRGPASPWLAANIHTPIQ